MKILRTFMPTAGAGTFASFCCRAKGWRPAGRDPPVLPFTEIRPKPKQKEQQIVNLLLSLNTATKLQLLK